jgi:hypothetical protein
MIWQKKSCCLSKLSVNVTWDTSPLQLHPCHHCWNFWNLRIGLGWSGTPIHVDHFHSWNREACTKLLMQRCQVSKPKDTREPGHRGHRGHRPQTGQDVTGRWRHMASMGGGTQDSLQELLPLLRGLADLFQWLSEFPWFNFANLISFNHLAFETETTNPWRWMTSSHMSTASSFH